MFPEILRIVRTASFREIWRRRGLFATLDENSNTHGRVFGKIPSARSTRTPLFSSNEGRNGNGIQVNNPLWKRVIAWERSRAASGYGIIWGDADQTRRNLVRNVIAWIGFNRTTDSNKIEVIVLDDQKSRELRRIRTTGLAVFIFVRLYDIVNIHSNADMSK